MLRLRGCWATEKAHPHPDSVWSGDRGHVILLHHPCGGMAEWLIAALLKSVVALDVTGGSNPSPSAIDLNGQCRYNARTFMTGGVPERPIGAAC